MRSTSGQHYIALDHVRAVAALLVFSWHFIHRADGFPVPFEGAPAVFPLALLDEGHTGVALFMTLSGYLFAKLLDGRQVHYRAFLWNRLLRLAPLLVMVVVAAGLIRLARGGDLVSYLREVGSGFVLPTLPNGGWSVTAEFHFYLLLPLFLWLLRRNGWSLFLVIAGALLLRSGLALTSSGVQRLAYLTLVGRLDQFLLGILAFHHRRLFTGRHGLAVAVMLGFALLYWRFDLAGGFYQNRVDALWVPLPTLEGLAYGIAIAWYDNSFTHSRGWVSQALARAGQYSYSIYLLHFFVVFRASSFVHQRIMDLSNFYVACAWSLVCFAGMAVMAGVSYQLIELPFLRLRRPYLRSKAPAPTAAA